MKRKPLWKVEPDDGGADGGGGNKPPEFTAITTQEDFDKAVADRVKRAKKSEAARFADYDDLKRKADEFDAQQQANQSEAEKAAARVTKLEEDLATERLDNLRRRIAAEHEVTDGDDIRLFLTGTDEETLTAQAERLAERDAERKKRGNRVPREGQTSSNKPDPKREFLRELSGAD